MTPAKRRPPTPEAQVPTKPARKRSTKAAPAEDAVGAPDPAAGTGDGAPEATPPPPPRRSVLHPERVWPD